MPGGVEQPPRRPTCGRAAFLTVQSQVEQEMVPPIATPEMSAHEAKREPTSLARRPMRVAHLIHGLEVGGAEKLLIEFARHVSPERFALSFVYLGP